MGVLNQELILILKLAFFHVCLYVCMTLSVCIHVCTHVQMHVDALVLGAYTCACICVRRSEVGVGPSLVTLYITY